MKILISPAKSLDYKSALPTTKYTEPAFLSEAQQINVSLKTKSPAELQKLMHISEKLADLNWERNQQFETPFTTANARPAVFAFNGDVYSGLEAYSLSESALGIAQQNLRILSGLYGILKPLDLMQPYRLEMGTSFGLNGQNSLYAFWKDQLTTHLKNELSSSELVVNLASKEYASAIDFDALNTPVIHPVFKDFKNGKLKIISFFAKKARGLMTRYLIETNAQTTEDVLAFTAEGYAFSETETTDTSQPVFVR
ncbi:MAG: peroxide stress protein YaaA [Bacteroidetes bacterium]|nr:peroxide stress protein YaaA [Bacteroidota bacterium]MDA0889115.1 peroxide stress protein YaaA [Bacteroidota bacterium]MDA1084915.1 peroxide stress protein YaaA [Bacteroidota bacterium]